MIIQTKMNRVQKIITLLVCLFVVIMMFASIYEVNKESNERREQTKQTLEELKEMQKQLKDDEQYWKNRYLEERLKTIEKQDNQADEICTLSFVECNSNNEEPTNPDSVIREVTAYNAGDVYQTDDTPCIAANGENICMALAMGYKRCAANFVPFGTILDIQYYGKCMVTDRMNRRYANRVDVAMQKHEKERALKWGVQNLQVTIVK